MGALVAGPDCSAPHLICHVRACNRLEQPCPIQNQKVLQAPLHMLPGYVGSLPAAMSADTAATARPARSLLTGYVGTTQVVRVYQGHHPLCK